MSHFYPEEITSSYLNSIKLRCLWDVLLKNIQEKLENTFLAQDRDVAGLGHHLQDRNRDDVCGYYFLD